MLKSLNGYEERLKEAREFADKLGLRDQLEGKLKYLDEYKCWGQETECRFGADFAPLCFAFAMFFKGKDGEYKYSHNGGLIYQGPEQPADGGAPSFTVSMDPTKIGWFTHT